MSRTDCLVQMTFLAESRASQQLVALVAEKYALEKLGHLVSSDLGGNPTPCQLLLSTPALSEAAYGAHVMETVLAKHTGMVLTCSLLFHFISHDRGSFLNMVLALCPNH